MEGWVEFYGEFILLLVFTKGNEKKKILMLREWGGIVIRIVIIG